MNKFLFKSTDADFQKLIQSQLGILNGNILYLTREVDRLVKMVKQMTVNKDLQQQVDKYFEEGSSYNSDEASPQTDLDEQK